MSVVKLWSAVSLGVLVGVGCSGKEIVVDRPDANVPADAAPGIDGPNGHDDAGPADARPIDAPAPADARPLDAAALADAHPLDALPIDAPRPDAGILLDTTITSGPPPITSSPAATISFTATIPGATFQCSLDGAAYTACTTPAVYTVPSGTHTFTVYATDPGGNPDPTPASISWTVMLPGPGIEITGGPPDGGSSGPTVTFTYVVVPPQSPVTYQCELDGASFAGCSPDGITYNGLPPGSIHTFCVHALDAAHDVGPQACSTFTVDSTPPGIAFEDPTPPEGAITPPAPVFQFDVSPSEPPTTTYQCHYDNEAAFACDLDTPYTRVAFFPTGPHSFTVTATDPGGNTTTIVRHVIVDATLPGIAFVPPTPAEGATVQPAVIFEYHDTPPEPATTTYTCQLDAEPSFACSPDTMYTHPDPVLNDGPHRFTVIATNVAGLRSTIVRDVIIDGTPPGIGFTHEPTPLEGATIPGSSEHPSDFQFHVTPSEPASTHYVCRFDDEGGFPCHPTQSYQHPGGFTDGPHFFTVVATDVAQNVRTIVRHVIVDFTAPGITFDYSADPSPHTPGDETTVGVSPNPPFEFTVSPEEPPATTYLCTFDIASEPLVVACSPSTPILHPTAFPDGPHTLTVTATDPYFNPSTITTHVSIDATPPNLAFDYSGDPAHTPGNGTVVGVSPNPPFTFTVDPAETNATYQCTFDQGTAAAVVVACSPGVAMSHPTPFSDGAHSLTVTGTDEHGNTSAPIITTVAIDATPPGIAFDYAGDPAHTPGNGTTVGVSPNPPFTFTVAPAETSATYVCSFDLGTAAAVVVACAPGVATFHPTAFTDGAHTLTVVATDEHGNTSAPIITSVVIDATPPGIAFDYSGDPAHTPGNATVLAASPNPPFTFTVSPAETSATYLCTFDPGTGAAVVVACAPGVAMFHPTTFTEGTHLLTVTGTDQFGNPKTISTSVTVDSTPPIVVWDYVGGHTPANPSTIGGLTHTYEVKITSVEDPTPSVACTLTNAAHPGGVDLACADGVLEPGASAFAAGLNTLSVTATDIHGNTSAAVTTAFTIDTTPPTVAWDYASGHTPANPSTIVGLTHTYEVVISSVEDPTPSVACTVTNSAHPTGTTLACADGVLEPGTGTFVAGLNTLSVVATDIYGNASAAVSTAFTITLDTTPPTVVWDYASGHTPANPSTVGGSTHTYEVKITSVEDPTPTVACTLTNSAHPTGATLACADGVLEPGTGAFVAGLNTLSVIATDIYGNASSPVTTAFTVDTTPPTVAWDYVNGHTPANGATVTLLTETYRAKITSVEPPTPTVACTLTNSAHPSGVALVCADGVVEPGTGVFAGGLNTLSVIATDIYGNASSPAVTTFTVDLTPPTVVWDYVNGHTPANGATLTALSETYEAKISPFVSPTPSIACKVTNTANPSGITIPCFDSVLETGTFVAGLNTLSATATDGNGTNSATVTTTFTVTPIIAPIIDASSCQPEDLAGGALCSLTVHSGDDAFGCTCALDSGTATDCTPSTITCASGTCSGTSHPEFLEVSAGFHTVHVTCSENGHAVTASPPVAIAVGDGHVVLMGWDLTTTQSSTPSPDQVFVNAVTKLTIARKFSRKIQVLGVTGPLVSATAHDNALAKLDATTLGSNRALWYTEVSGFDDATIDANLVGKDVVVLFNQNDAVAAAAVTDPYLVALQKFVIGGGVVVTLDGGTGLGGPASNNVGTAAGNFKAIGKLPPYVRSKCLLDVTASSAVRDLSSGHCAADELNNFTSGSYPTAQSGMYPSYYQVISMVSGSEQQTAEGYDRREPAICGGEAAQCVGASGLNQTTGAEGTPCLANVFHKVITRGCHGSADAVADSLDLKGSTVDSIYGSDSYGTGSCYLPYQTLTHAMAVDPQERIDLMPGVYANPTPLTIPTPHNVDGYREYADATYHNSHNLEKFRGDGCFAVEYDGNVVLAQGTFWNGIKHVGDHFQSQWAINTAPHGDGVHITNVSLGGAPVFGIHLANGTGGQILTDDLVTGALSGLFTEEVAGPTTPPAIVRFSQFVANKTGIEFAGDLTTDFGQEGQPGHNLISCNQLTDVGFDVYPVAPVELEGNIWDNYTSSKPSQQTPFPCAGGFDVCIPEGTDADFAHLDTLAGSAGGKCGPPPACVPSGGGTSVTGDVTVHITADNSYTFGYGTLSGIPAANYFDFVSSSVAGDIFNCTTIPGNPQDDPFGPDPISAGPEVYVVPNASIPGGSYLYITAYDDLHTTQGVLGQFYRAGIPFYTGDPRWEVCAIGVQTEVDLDVINEQIALCNAGGTSTATTSGGWVGVGGAVTSGAVGHLAIGQRNDSTGPDFNPTCMTEQFVLYPDIVNKIDGAARWMWYFPDDGGPSDAFQSNGTNRFKAPLIFRIPTNQLGICPAAP